MKGNPTILVVKVNQGSRVHFIARKKMPLLFLLWVRSELFLLYPSLQRRSLFEIVMIILHALPFWDFLRDRGAALHGASIWWRLM